MSCNFVEPFFTRAADALALEETLREALSLPQRETTVQLRVPFDDGVTRVLQGWRVQHNDARGPFKGGIRFHPQVSIDEFRTFASLMTWKTALLDLPFGGGKGGVGVDPTLLSMPELERVSRAFIRELIPVIGVHTDVMAPDVNTDEPVMEWMYEEYRNCVSDKPAIVTGKPTSSGGVDERAAATGRGAFLCLDSIARKWEWDRSTCRIAVQGFGAAGRHFALHAVAAGYKVVAVSDSKGAIVHEHGLDATAALQHKRATGSVVDMTGTETIDADALLAVECDVFAPAALEEAINSSNQHRVRAGVVLEVANYPVSVDATDALEERGVRVVPDVLANAGGVTVSYYEWARNLGLETFVPGEVDDRLRSAMELSTQQVLRRAKEGQITLRQAAYELAVDRVAAAERGRRKWGRIGLERETNGL